MKPARRDPRAALRVLRGAIDRLDARIVRLLSRRARLALRAAALKRRAGLREFDPARESAVLDRAGKRARAPLRAEHARAAFAEVVSAARALQTDARVAHVRAPDIERAARAQFGSFARYLAADDAREAVALVERGEADAAVVPESGEIPLGVVRAAAVTAHPAAVVLVRRA